MARSCGDDMTKPNLLRGSSLGSCFLRGRQSALISVCPAKGVCTLCTLLCTGGLSACIVVRPSWFCLHQFMMFFVAGDMTSRLRSSVSLDVPGSAGTSLGYLRPWRPIRRQCAGVWDPDSSSGPVQVWLICPAWAPRAGSDAHFPFRGAYAGVECRPGRVGRGGGGLAPERPAVVGCISMTAGL